MQPSSEPRAAVIFDRDGVLNVDHGYVHRPEDLDWISGSKAAVARLNQLGVLVLVVTNQSGVARGYYDEAAVETFHAAMQAQLASVGAHIDGFYACPFHPEAVNAAYRHPDHPDRKPNPGMILRAIREWRIDPTRAILIGNKPSDVEAAARAGIAGAIYAGGDLERFAVEKLISIGVAPS